MQNYLEWQRCGVCVVDLTSDDLDRLDPTGRGRALLASMKDSKPTPRPSLFTDLDRNEWLDWWCARRNKISVRNPEEIGAWEDAVMSKYAAQGARFSLTEVQDKYLESYAFAQSDRSFDLVIRGSKILCSMIHERIAQKGYPQPSARSWLRTSGALPSMDKKTTWFAETVGFKPYRHVIPVLPGQRSQRNSHRVINQDACSNVRLWEREMNAIRDFLRSEFPQFFSGWLNPRAYMRPMISSHLARGDAYSVELDYKSCDTHFSLEVANTVLMPVYEAFFPSETVFIEFWTYIQELFHQEIFFGDYLWSGLHNLFSGQVITNDFETIYDVCLQLGALACLDARHRSVLQLANGDDQSIVVHDKSLARQLMDVLCLEANANGLEVSSSKSAIRERGTAFCRRLYLPGAPADDSGLLGIYPSILTLNAVINPEHRSKTITDEWCSTVQRMDNLYGSPYFASFVEGIGAKIRKRLRAVDPTVFKQSYDPFDWWERLYGERWTYLTSPSFKLLQSAKIWTVSEG